MSSVIRFQGNNFPYSSERSRIKIVTPNGQVLGYCGKQALREKKFWRCPVVPMAQALIVDSSGLDDTTPDPGYLRILVSAANTTDLKL